MKKKKVLKPAVFFDRDGTLIHDVGYLSRLAQIRLFPQTAPALKSLREAGFYLFIVTNQSGAARGYFPVSMVHQAHRKLQMMLKSKGARIDAFFYCPHYPQGKVKSLSKVCDCRKPKPGMIRQALKRYPIDLKRSYVVGDKVDDVLLAKNARLAGSLLVRTGNGKKSAQEWAKLKLKKSAVVGDVSQAARWILKKEKQS
jgi:D-glycero-D-manno-heptose 1,7-bisphosphate phosphatase